MLQEINSIPFKDILPKLGIEYTEDYDNLSLHDEGITTSGWKVNTTENYANDFSEKERAIGPPYVFVKKFLKLTNRQTIEWFKEYFRIETKAGATKGRKQKSRPRHKIYSREHLLH